MSVAELRGRWAVVRTEGRLSVSDFKRRREARRYHLDHHPPRAWDLRRRLSVWRRARAATASIDRRVGEEKQRGMVARDWTCSKGTRGCTECHWSDGSRAWDRLTDRCTPLYGNPAP